MTDGKRMTAEDYAEIERDWRASDGHPCVLHPSTLTRILATYHALAASQQEVERLRAEVATHAEWAREYGKTRDGEAWLALIRERDESRAAIDAAREDSARLDWLEQNRANTRWTDYEAIVASPRGLVYGSTLRAAIDAARRGTE